MRPAPLRVLLAFVVLGVAATADAQTDPIPILPPEEPLPDPSTLGDPDPAQADPAAAPADTTSARTTAWDYSLGIGAGWESNVGAQISTPGISDYSGYFFGRLGRSATKARSRTSFYVGGSGYVYQDLNDFDRLDGTGGFDGTWNLSRRTTLNLGLGARYGHTDTSPILSDQGLVYGVTRTIDYAGDIGLTQALSSRTSLRLTARAFRVDFPESEVLRDTTSLRLSAGLDHRIGRYDTLSAEYSAERVEGVNPQEGEPPYWTHYGSGIWQRLLGRRTALRVEGGASYTPREREETGTVRWRFFGGASLTRSVEDNTFSLFYRREVLPAFGVGGLRFTDRVGLDTAIPLGRTVTFALGGFYARDAEADALGERLETVDGNAALTARLARWASLSAEGRYYRRWPYQMFPELENYRVGLFLVFGSGNGRPPRY